MKKFYRVTARLLLVVAVSAIFFQSTIVFAISPSDWEKYDNEEKRRIEEIINSENPEQYIGVVNENVPTHNDGPTTYITCIHCGLMIGNYCLKEAILDDEGIHKYGFLNQNECYAYWFVSHGMDYCGRCDYVQTTHGPHACIEKHMDCSFGEYDVCPMLHS